MKPDKQGRYRVNFYLNPENTKDNIIINYLNQRYSAADYIKETLYNLAYEIEMPYTGLNRKKLEIVQIKEEYDEIEELGEIEL